MKHLAFSYRVEANIELTGYELDLLRFFALRHYDSVCKEAFRHGGFGFGWINHFVFLQMGSSDLDQEQSGLLFRDSHELASQSFKITATFRELDTCAKALEAAYGNPLGGVFGRFNPDTLGSLIGGIHQTLSAIRREQERLERGKENPLMG
jgi:hypothetical protein